MKSDHLTPPMGGGFRARLDDQFYQMEEDQPNMAFDSRQLRSPHAFDLLGHVFDIELIGNIAACASELADRRRLLLGPQQYVLVVEGRIAHPVAPADVGLP